MDTQRPDRGRARRPTLTDRCPPSIPPVTASYSLLVVDPEFVRQIVAGSADLFPKGHL